MLSVEITRRCNQECIHCLRGDAREEDLEQWVIDAIVRAVSDDDVHQMINDTNGLYLTGGEPFLRPDIIIQLLERCPDLALTVTTNGTVDTKEAYYAAALILGRNQWVYGNPDEDMCAIVYSNDQFHKPASCVWKRLAIARNGGKVNPEYLYAMGRARDNGTGNRNKVNSLGDHTTITVSGLIVDGCDYEYGEETILGTLPLFDLRKRLYETFEAVTGYAYVGIYG